MDPVQKLWMFENWQADQIDKIELAKNHAYLLASFSNPEAVKKMLGEDKIESTDEEFDETSRLVKEMSLKELGLKTPNKRKRKRVLKEG